MLNNTSSIICAFCLAACISRSPHRHLELCGIALTFLPFLFDATSAASSNVMVCVSLMITPIMQFQDGQSLCPSVPL